MTGERKAARSFRTHFERDEDPISEGGMCRCLETENGYAEIVRWDGAVAILEVAKRFTGRKYGVEHGDLIEATIDEIVLKGLSHRRHRSTSVSLTPTPNTDSHTSGWTPTTTDVSIRSGATAM